MIDITSSFSFRQQKQMAGNVFSIVQATNASDWEEANARSPSMTGALLNPQVGTESDATSGTFFNSYEADLKREQQELANDISMLYRLYLIDHPRTVSTFLQSHRTISSVLIEAEPYLKKSFGPKVLSGIRVISDEQEAGSIRVSVNWPGQVSEAVIALAKFDETFWLANCRRGTGRVIFDYDLI